MPPRNKNRRRPGRRPNVFVQTEEPTARPQRAEPTEENITAPAAITTSATPTAPSTLSAAGASPRTSGPRRTQRTRSEVYARTFPLEIRKMGVISAGVVIALAVFTFVL